MTKTLKLEGATKRAAKNALAGQLASSDDAAAYAADVTEKAVSEDSLQNLRALAAELLDAAREVTRINNQLQKATARLADIQEHKLPDLMDANEIPRFDFMDSTTGTRYIIENKANWRVSMPPLRDKDGNTYPENVGKRKAIMSWFREIGLGGIIKKEVSAPLGRMRDEDVEALVTDIKSRHPELELGISEEIHPSTLKSQVRTLKDAGKDVHEDLQVTPVRTAAITVK
jgi:hypothetical protein